MREQSKDNVRLSQVTGMRNYIVHEYFQVDNTVIWDVVQNDLPLLETQVRAYLKDFSADPAHINDEC